MSLIFIYRTCVAFCFLKLLADIVREFIAEFPSLSVLEPLMRERAYSKTRSKRGSMRRRGGIIANAYLRFTLSQTVF